MTFMRLLLRNLFYHWRGNLAVFFGAAVGTAVLTGALFVGDSLQNSLRSLALDQLGWVEISLTANRFFREELTQELKAKKIAPALYLQASASFESSASLEVKRANKITVLGVNGSFWPPDNIPLKKAFWQSAGENGAVLNQALAKRFGVQIGDVITLHVQRADNLPRESLLGRRDSEKLIQEIEVKVRQILPDRGIGGFSLRPSPEPARNVFVPLAFLQNKLGLQNRVNAILATGDPDVLQKRLRQTLTLEDWNLRLQTPAERGRNMLEYLNSNRPTKKLREFKWKDRVPEGLANLADKDGVLTPEDFEKYFRENRPYLSLESTSMFLEPTVQQAVEQIVQKNKDIQARKILIYLADTLTDGEHESPYVVIGAVAPMSKTPQASKQLEQIYKLSENEMLLAQWSESPFEGKPTIDMIYYVPDEKGDLQKKKKTFTVVDRFELKGFFDDANLTPEFPGITDKLDMGSWDDPPFPYDGTRVGPDDEQYWHRYRATPRAYIAFETAQQLWASRFGKITSIHVDLLQKNSREFTRGKIDEFTRGFKRKLLQQLSPKTGGFIFDDTKKRALRSGGGSTDFGMYFLAFSFFLIVAALLLVGLLFRLNLDRRASEFGLLMAMGLRRWTVRLLLLAEGGVLALAGGIIGLAGAMAYGIGLVYLLRAQWPEGQDLSYLGFHASWMSIAIGYAASVAVSVLAILWAVRALSRVSPSRLLAGQTMMAESVQKKTSKRVWNLVICGASLIGAIALLIMGIMAEHHEAKAFSFFGGGGLLLITFLSLVWYWIKNTRPTSTEFTHTSLGWLGVRNAQRHPVRSLLTVGLLASATFLIVAVESFHRETGATFFAKDGGSGGFRLLGETNVPLFVDLDDVDAGLKSKQEFAESRGKTKQAEQFAKIAQQAGELIPKIDLYSCRVKEGDDVSCLNLYQPLRPKIVGVPDALVERGGFQFGNTLAATDAEKNNPWLLLQKKLDDAVPVFVDATTAQYILKVTLGDDIEVPDEKGKTQKLRVVGLLSESIFQSEVLMSDTAFQRLFPRSEGFRYFLIDVSAENQSKIKKILETGFSSYGFVATPTDEKLKSYLAVENTYLGMFKMLGGFGLLLGALGLSVVLLRGVWERRGELALMRAMGFRRRALGWLVLAENCFLLALGLVVGTVAALISVAPHLTTTGGDLLLRIVILLTLVVVVGLIAGIAAVISTLRAPLLIALRKE